MDVVYASDGATATRVYQEMADPPTRTAVRTFLRILEEKGYVEHRKHGREFVYRPTRPRGVEGRSALRHILLTFFDGSLERALGTYLNSARINPAERKRLVALFQESGKNNHHRNNHHRPAARAKSADGSVEK